MRFIADLHIHSKYSRATSRDMSPEGIWKWAQLKGIIVIGTGDFTHPAWFKELNEKLEPVGNGLFRLKMDLQTEDVPDTCRAEVYFLLSAEISCIYSKIGRTRKIHSIVFAPDFKDAARISIALSKIGNLSADGRPILGLDAKELLKIVIDVSPQAMLVPAHAWTPHFSVFGAVSGFDSLEECFEDLTPHIHAIETGLSSDPAINWRLSALDKITLISNSDAHSPAKIGREANILDAELSYKGITRAIKTREGFLGTIEFFPEEGKYH
ncbi:MAG TPA: DNA helicase UvrD, partial [Deltaproteobacteria bacterium]|nr:DNA helicase UvrD [Deltaproteobacteria bacterium]